MKEKIEFHNRVQDKRLEKIEHHTEVMNSELGSVKTDMATVKNDVNWLKRFFWILAGTSISTLIAQLFNISI